MNQHQQSLETLQDIKKMMERSSRFISLSGLSGISAGICALIGAAIARPYVFSEKNLLIDEPAGIAQAVAGDYSIIFNTWLFWIAAATFISALGTAFFFTWIKSRREGIPIWGTTARRLLINISIPLAVGAVYIFRLIHFGTFGLVAPGCLIFYGLGLINASKYTLGEIRYLGYLQLLLGMINLWFVGYGLYFWAMGFGVLHIVYGVVMWYKYERNTGNQF
ncbi:MAG: hypothetical protein JWQ27_987 [Ferruginibacter sp.]|nr:hypothetical protein [Ferruginibacter sp.]